MMRFADELADLDDFKFPAAEGIRPPELKMAMQLVDSLSAKWDPGKYTDEYRDNLMKVIEGKVKGRRPKLQERETTQSADVVDLMSRLRASLEGKSKAAGESKAGSKCAARLAGTEKGRTEKAKWACGLTPGRRLAERPRGRILARWGSNVC